MWQTQPFNLFSLTAKKLLYNGRTPTQFMEQGSCCDTSPTYRNNIDAVYRHLAAKWDTTYIAPHQKRRLQHVQSTELDGIEHLILLDLLGAPNPLIRSYFIDTAWLFDSLVSVERRLGDSGVFEYANEKGWKSWFRTRTENNANYGYMGDDHVPFLHRGVSVLHLISEPFPRVWHTLAVGPFNFRVLIPC